MFTLPLTAAEYRALVDAKYSPNADTLRGWALRDKQGRTQGWHPRVSAIRTGPMLTRRCMPSSPPPRNDATAHCWAGTSCPPKVSTTSPTCSARPAAN